MSAQLAERLFRAPLARFAAARHSQFIAPTGSAVVPRALRGLVRGIIGLDTRPLGHAGSSARGTASSGARAHAASQPSSAFPHTGTSSGCAAGVAAGEQGGNPATAGFTPNQYLGMSTEDLYVLARQGRFWDNYLRGLFGIWLQAMVLTAIGVFAGTFLSWPVLRGGQALRERVSARRRG